jgi:hypothetical protein
MNASGASGAERDRVIEQAIPPSGCASYKKRATARPVREDQHKLMTSGPPPSPLTRVQMDEPQWRKDLLKRNYPLVEHHSCCINQNVRYQFANMGIVGEMPERYERLKQAARVKAKVLEPELQKAGETEFLPILSAA